MPNKVKTTALAHCSLTVKQQTVSVKVLSAIRCRIMQVCLSASKSTDVSICLFDPCSTIINLSGGRRAVQTLNNCCPFSSHHIPATSFSHFLSFFPHPSVSPWKTEASEELLNHIKVTYSIPFHPSLTGPGLSSESEGSPLCIAFTPQH